MLNKEIVKIIDDYQNQVCNSISKIINKNNEMPVIPI